MSPVVSPRVPSLLPGSGWAVGQGGTVPGMSPLSPQAQVAFLQGERQGQENLKSDLVRRIKMLEFALKQERWDPHLGLGWGTRHPVSPPAPPEATVTSVSPLCPPQVQVPQAEVRGRAGEEAGGARAK